MEKGEPNETQRETKTGKPVEQAKKEEQKSEPAGIVLPVQPPPSDENRIVSVPSDLVMKEIWVSPNTSAVRAEPQEEPKQRAPLGRTRSKMSLVMIGQPIDLSFRNVTEFPDLGNLKPRSVRLRVIPPRAPSGRYLTAFIWASYNELESMDGLDMTFHKLLEYPEALTLLDLSFNRITDITEELVNFPQLKILRLHSNKIGSFNAVAKLSRLRALQTLTLKGNPIERHRNYRTYILQLLPQIKSLDFNQILIQERLKPIPLDADLLRNKRFLRGRRTTRRLTGDRRGTDVKK